MVRYDQIFIDSERRLKKKFKSLLLFASFVSFLGSLLVLFFFDYSIYSLSLVILSFSGFICSLIEFFYGMRSPSHFIIIYGSSIVMPHNILIMCAAAAHKYNYGIKYIIIISLIYYFILSYLEYRSVLKNPNFTNIAKSSIQRIGSNIYVVNEERIADILRLSFVKRGEGWILLSWKGKFQIAFIVLICILLLISFHQGYVGKSGSGIISFSLAIIILSLMSRPMFFSCIITQKVRVMKFSGSI